VSVGRAAILGYAGRLSKERRNYSSIGRSTPPVSRRMKAVVKPAMHGSMSPTTGWCGWILPGETALVWHDGSQTGNSGVRKARSFRRAI
jgi:hypothetical protein